MKIESPKLYHPIAIISHKSEGRGRDKVMKVRIRWKGYQPEDDSWEYVSPSKPNNVCLADHWNEMIEKYNPRLLGTWSIEALRKSEKRHVKSSIKLCMYQNTLTASESNYLTEIETISNDRMTTAEYNEVMHGKYEQFKM